MALFDIDKKNPPAAPVNPPQQPIPYNGVAVDSRHTPSRTLLTHIAGSRWVVTYYSQVLNQDNETSSQQIHRMEVYQQYKKINQFELKVTSPLSTSFDPEKAEHNVVGNANIYPGMIPNKGDMFTADIGDGRIGLFTVTVQPEQKTFFGDTAYSIEYMLVADNQLSDRLRDLENKVVQEYYYVKEFHDSNTNPIIAAEAYGYYRELTRYKEELKRRFFQAFYTNEQNTFLVPDQMHKTYDPWIMEYIKRVFGLTWEGAPQQMVTMLNTMDSAEGQACTVWDAILRRDRIVLDYVYSRIPVISVELFSREPRFCSIVYSGVVKAVYPAERLGFNPDLTPVCGLIEESKGNGIRRKLKLGTQITRTELNGFLDEAAAPIVAEAPDIHPVTADHAYVFSQAFYDEDTSGYSVLERLVADYIDNKTTDPKTVIRLCESGRFWGRVEQFYYWPVLYTLVCGAIRSLP